MSFDKLKIIDIVSAVVFSVHIEHFQFPPVSIPSSRLAPRADDIAIEIFYLKQKYPARQKSPFLQLDDGNLKRLAHFGAAVLQLLFVLAALQSAFQHQLRPNAEAFRISRVSAPCDAWDIVDLFVTCD